MILPPMSSLITTNFTGATYIVDPQAIFLSNDNSKFVNWFTYRAEAIHGLTNAGYSNDRAGLSKGIDDHGLDFFVGDYVFVLMQDLDINTHLSDSDLVVNGVIQGTSAPHTGGQSGTIQYVNPDFSNFNMSGTVGIGATFQQAQFDYQGGGGYLNTNFGPGSLIGAATDSLQAVIGFFSPPTGTVTVPSSEIILSGTGLDIASNYFTQTSTPGSTSFFVSKQAALDWFFPPSPPPSGSGSVFSMSYPPTNPAPTDILIPNHVSPAQKTPIHFQNYTQPLPRFIKK